MLRYSFLSIVEQLFHKLPAVFQPAPERTRGALIKAALISWCILQQLLNTSNRTMEFCFSPFRCCIAIFLLPVPSMTPSSHCSPG